MCRNIKTLFNFDPPATDEEVRAASLQFVRKLSGFNAPSKANAEAFDGAVEEVFAVARRLVDALVTEAPTRDRTVEAAWSAGIRYFDTAPVYGLGLADTRLGRVLRNRPRDEFILATKVGRRLVPCRPGEQNVRIFVDTPPLRFEFDYSYDAVMRSFEESLGRLGLDRVDILYVHDLDARIHADGRAQFRTDPMWFTDYMRRATVEWEPGAASAPAPQRPAKPQAAE